MKLSMKFEDKRKGLEFISEKTRYKILLTLLAKQPLSFSELRKLLPSIPENNLNYHIKILKENNFIKNKKVSEYKRSEPRSFYSLSDRSNEILKDLGLTDVKEELQALFEQMT
ncbi:MAG: helix-turn-helix transcriptional regulator [Candidatus Lokiarchaeota archaeon]|nr:helix-turn-helix transcriptional regulator [Candidatus Lokiarchaeota archaeon]